jgi:hypothetical protein
MMLRDATEFHQPLPKEAMAVFARIDMCITDDVGVGVIDGQPTVNPVVVLDPVVDPIAVSTQNHAAIAVLSNGFVGVLKIISHKESNSSVTPSNERYDWWFVSVLGSSPLFESPRERGLSWSSPFSPAVT